MNNYEDDRPWVKGETEHTSQYVEIGFVGIKCCGKPVVYNGRVGENVKH